jgi:hypothetical protein
MDFYKIDDSYILLTGESPRGFRGVLYAAWHGHAIDSFDETVLSVAQLAAMTPVEIADVPDEWYNAFSNVSGLFAARKPVAEPEPAPEPEPEPVAESEPTPEPAPEPELWFEPWSEPEPEAESELWSVTLTIRDLSVIFALWFGWNVLKCSMGWF